MSVERGDDTVHITESELVIPQDLQGVLVRARKRIWTPDETPIEIPGKFGHNKLLYHDVSLDLFYENESVDSKIPGVFSCNEEIKTIGSGSMVHLTYSYNGELTERGFETGQDRVDEMLKYFLQKHVDKVRLGITFDTEHFDEGKWAYTSIGTHGRSIWRDVEYLAYGNEHVYIINGIGTVFQPQLRLAH